MSVYHVSAHRAFSLMREMDHERLSGSLEELAAAERLLKEMQAAGVDAHIEEFRVPGARVGAAKLVVTEPYKKEYPVTGYERSAATPEGGLDAPFYYAEDLEAVHLQNIRGKIVMTNLRLRPEEYEKLQKNGAAAILTFSGRSVDRVQDTDHEIRRLREPLTEANGHAIAMHLRTADAMEIVRRGATAMHLELDSEYFDAVSHNVCAVIPGTKFPEQIISFGGHYDTVHFSHGVYDNMSGSVIVLELLRYFAANPPMHTLKFNLFGSEEQGLLGSKAWTAAHKDELEKHIMMINIDVAAPVLGRNRALVMANPEAVSYVDGLMKQAGFACDVKGDIYSSDSIPFTDNGVPAINLCRFGADGANYIHNRHDRMQTGYLSEKALDITLQQALMTATVLDSAVCFPIARKIDEKIREKVDKYLFRKKD